MCAGLTGLKFLNLESQFELNSVSKSDLLLTLSLQGPDSTDLSTPIFILVSSTLA